MKKEILELLIKQYQGDDLAGYVSDIIKTEKVIKRKVIVNTQSISDEQMRHTCIVDNLRIELRKIQQDCPHYEYVYYPDAAGGNDSWYMCELCGKETKTMTDTRC